MSRIVRDARCYSEQDTASNGGCGSDPKTLGRSQLLDTMRLDLETHDWLNPGSASRWYSIHILALITDHSSSQARKGNSANESTPQTWMLPGNMPESPSQTNMLLRRREQIGYREMKPFSFGLPKKFCNCIFPCRSGALSDVIL